MALLQVTTGSGEGVFLLGPETPRKGKKPALGYDRRCWRETRGPSPPPRTFDHHDDEDTTQMIEPNEPLRLPQVEGLSPKEAALLYGSHGWPVFPCEASNHDPVKKSWSKKPHRMLREEEAERGEGGWKLATTDPEKVTAWWDRDPVALIGLVPGMGGAVVIDADGAPGIKALYDEAKDLDLTTTATGRTPGKGGGLHVWFDRRHLPGTIGNGSLLRVPGEARGDRGYVIVPPSRLPDGGEYRYVGHTYDLAPLPEWASALLPWETAGAANIRASIADVTRGDEQEWLIAMSAPESDAAAKAAIEQAVRETRQATPGDVDRGRHPTAVKHAASLLSRAQKREFAINLVAALDEVRSALVSVKPGGGADFDRFVSDAIALRVSEDRARSASVVDISLLRREEEVWEDPADLTPASRGTSRPFPTDALPDVMRRVVEEVSRATQMAETFPALAALGAASAATAGGFLVSLNNAWDEGLSLYLIGVADPSERKTAALKPFVDSIRWAAARWTESVSQDRAQWEAEGAALDYQMKEAKKLAGTPEGRDEIAKLTLYSEDHAREGQRFVLPNRLVHSDPTQEALVVEMKEQHGVGFLASSEGAFVANLAGRYSNSERNDLSLVNDAYSRTFIRSTRVGRGDTIVETPHLAIVSLIQPRVAEMLAHPDFEGTGFLSRLLYAHPPSMVGTRATSLSRYSAMYGVAMDAWKSRMEAVFARGWGRETDPHVLTIDHDAAPLFEAWWAKCEALAPTDPWWGKAHGHVIRVASVMELVEDPAATRVSRASIEAAIEVVRFFAEERALMRVNVLDGGAASYQMSEGVRRALSHIARRWSEIEAAGGQVSVREFGRWMRLSKAEAFALAEEMVEQGWLREGDLGRVNTIAYVPHPSIPEAAAALAIASGGKPQSGESGESNSDENEGGVEGKNPGGIRENDPSGESVAGGVRVRKSPKGIFTSSSSSSYIESDALAQTDAVSHGVITESLSRGNTPTPRDTFATSPENPYGIRENEGKSGATVASQERDTFATSRENLEETLSQAVDQVLAESDVQQALSGLAGAADEGEKSGGAWVSHEDRAADRAGESRESSLPPPRQPERIFGVPRCRVCKAMLMTLADGTKRCSTHGEQRT